MGTNLKRLLWSVGRLSISLFLTIYILVTVLDCSPRIAVLIRLMLVFISSREKREGLIKLLQKLSDSTYCPMILKVYILIFKEILERIDRKLLDFFERHIEKKIEFVKEQIAQVIKKKKAQLKQIFLVLKQVIRDKLFFFIKKNNN